MGVQTVINDNPDLARAGQLEGLFCEIISKKAQVDTSAGLAVVQGTADDQCKLPTSSGDVAKVLGVAKFDPTMPNAWPPGVSVAYPAGQAVAIVRKGRLYVLAEEAVNAQDPVYIRYAAGGGGTQLGAFRKSADSGTAAQCTRAVYLMSIAAPGLVLVEFNLI